ncbi:MAG: RDD family protein [Pseudomonadota bacterium]
MVGIGGGYVIALATGETTASGFHLRGLPALALFTLVALYFVVGKCTTGGTVWDRLLRARQTIDTDEIRDLPLRAGVWRRLIAFAIDSLVISLLFQLLAAGLFTITSGRVQMRGDLNTTTCVTRTTLPDGEAPPAAAGTIHDCSITLFGLPTARVLQIGDTSAGDGQTIMRSSWLTPDGHPIDALPLDGLAMVALILALVLMECRSGTTLGSRITGIRVIDAAAIDSATVPPHKVAGRYLAVLIGALPLLAVAIATIGPQGIAAVAGQTVLADLTSRTVQCQPMLLSTLLKLPDGLSDAAEAAGSGWLVEACALLAQGWILFLIVQIATKRDPLYDGLVGTAVVRVKDRTGT